jgi:hypothetical protein
MHVYVVMCCWSGLKTRKLVSLWTRSEHSLAGRSEQRKKKALASEASHAATDITISREISAVIPSVP